MMRYRQNKKNKFYISQTSKINIIIIAIIFILTFLITTRFILKERKTQVIAAENYLVEITDHNTAMVRTIFENYVNILRALTVYLEYIDDFNSPEILGYFEKTAETFGFERISIDFPNENAQATDGVMLGIADYKKLNGVQISITNTTDKVDDGTPIVRIKVPLYRNGLPIAVLSCSIKTYYLSDVVKAHIINNDEYFSIIDGNGRYVVSHFAEGFASNLNFFDSLDTLIYSKGFSKELIEKAFADYKRGHTEYALNGEIRYGYYAPVGINDWFILTVIPKYIVDTNVNRFIASSLVLSLQIALMFFCIALLIYFNQKRMRAITELNERCFRILAENTGKTVLEWNYVEREMYFSNFKNTYGEKAFEIKFDLPKVVINSDGVHPDDCEMFKKMLYSIIAGQSIENKRFRLLSDDESYQYHLLSSVVVCDSKGKPYKSIGFLENIDTQVRKEEVLRLKANIDQLTGFYNKSATEANISEILASSENKTIHALLCIDLDNFKSINDEFGHLYGDNVLKELATEIKILFRKSDILGRFGGDEFAIFVPDIPSIEFIKKKASDLVKCLNKTYYNGDNAVTVSASVGIAISPTDGNTYKELYKKADEASYKVKTSGKKAYSFAI